MQEALMAELLALLSKALAVLEACGARVAEVWATLHGAIAAVVARPLGGLGGPCRHACLERRAQDCIADLHIHAFSMSPLPSACSDNLVHTQITLGWLCLCSLQPRVQMTLNEACTCICHRQQRPSKIPTHSHDCLSQHKAHPGRVDPQALASMHGSLHIAHKGLVGLDLHMSLLQMCLHCIPCLQQHHVRGRKH